VRLTPLKQVRNESAEDFLILLKEWKILCNKYISAENINESNADGHLHSSESGISDNDDDDEHGKSPPPESGEFEVERILGIRHVGGADIGKAKIEMKV
jgi:DNA (cytosine-5)-methyltransferase 1